MEQFQEVKSVKVGEDDDFVYFAAEIPLQVSKTSPINTMGTIVTPASATLTTAVNKAQGKVAFTI